MITSSTLTELHYQLGLLRTPRVGPRTYKALVERFGSAGNVFCASSETLAPLGLTKETLEWLNQPDWKKVQNDLRWLEIKGHYCLDLQAAGYPQILGEIADPPPLIFVRGDVDALSLRQIAVVGSRNPSPIGEKLARDFSRTLTEAGFAVTSGLALGIDAAAHQGAMDNGGVTLAVAGTGLDQVYPRRHQELADAIVARDGALVSEFPTLTPPQAANFPRRNRIISGLSLGILVVEAALRSGSLITARMALEQGREVFAVPGSINNPLARGCNALIKQGAKLVETVDDILEEFAFSSLPAKPHALQQPPIDELDSECHSLLKYIAYAPTSVDTLVAATGNTPEAVASCLLLLELQGYLVPADGGYCRTR